jgi:hypothetical protein
MDDVLFDDGRIVVDKRTLDLFVLCSSDQIFEEGKILFDVCLFDYQLYLINDNDDHVIMTKERLFSIYIYKEKNVL